MRWHTGSMSLWRAWYVVVYDKCWFLGDQQTLQREGGVREGFLGEIRVELGFKRGEVFGRSDGRRCL